MLLDTVDEYDKPNKPNEFYQRSNKPNEFYQRSIDDRHVETLFRLGLRLNLVYNASFGSTDKPSWKIVDSLIHLFDHLSVISDPVCGDNA